MRSTRSRFALAVVALAGCTHNYVPRPVSIERRVGELAVPDPVRVVNAQPRTDTILLGRQGGHAFLVNLNAWTDSAVSVMRTELTKRGMPAAPEAEKELKLSVTDVTGQFGFWTIGCIATLQVGTAGGLSKRFEGGARSSRNVFAANDVCLARAVAEALNDPGIVGYLQRPAR